jgi:intermediate peptidase
VLKCVLTDHSIVRSLSPEAYRTALIFWRDFENSAINLPSEQRERFVSLSSEILVLGRQFLKEGSAPRPPTKIKPSELDGLKDKGLGSRLLLQAQATQRDLLIYPGSPQAQMIMRSAPAEEPRKRLYEAAQSSTADQVVTLENLLRARAQLAQLVGKDSFAEMTLDDKMARSPGKFSPCWLLAFGFDQECIDNVRHFLDTLMNHTRPHARRALRTLAERKQAETHASSLPIIQAWDRDHYCPPEPPAPPIPLPPLTVGTVFMGLSRLFRHLYGISLRPADVAPGEVWETDVHKLEVVHEDEGVIGWIYADLFVRTGKASGAAHYTVRCSRRTDGDDNASDLAVTNGEEGYVRYSQAFEAMKRHRIRGQEGIYQLPLVVLLCEFGDARHRQRPTVLEWHEVMTLFHEMGHAMHCKSTRQQDSRV